MFAYLHNTGVTLKATAPVFTPANRVSCPPGVGFPPAFLARMTASVPSICSMLPKVEGKKLEDAYWSNREMFGYEITPADVIMSYMNDTTSFRTAFFLQKLCLRRVCFGNWSVSPEEVIAVFRSNKSHIDKRDLAIARFKSECCLRGLPLNGEPIAPDSVVAHFKQINVPLELARFQNTCCRRGIMIFGQPVPAELVLESYKWINAQLEAARFLQDCCLTGLPLYGQHVVADDVIGQFPDTDLGRLGAARFRDNCFQHGCLLNGEPISPEAVADNYREIRPTWRWPAFWKCAACTMSQSVVRALLPEKCCGTSTPPKPIWTRHCSGKSAT